MVVLLSRECSTLVGVCQANHGLYDERWRLRGLEMGLRMRIF